MISYGGVGLTPPSHDAAEAFVGWHGFRVEEFEHPGYQTWGVDYLPIPQSPVREPIRIGALHWPTGASQWATCHLLATSDSLAALGSSGAVRTLRFDDGTTQVDAQMYMLPPRPIVNKEAGKGLFLLTFVDQRWYWWQAGAAGGPPRPNVAEPSQTWAQLFSFLFNQVGVSATVDTVPSGYDLPSPSRWDTGAKPVPLLLDAAAACVGMRVVVQRDGTVAVQSAAAAQTAVNANVSAWRYEVLTGGEIASATLLRSVPSSVDVVFWGTPPAVLPRSGAGTAPRGSGLIVADLPAQATFAKRSAYATQAAADYYTWANGPAFDATLRAFCTPAITGMDQYVEWVHHPDQFSTRVVYQAWSDSNVYGDKPPLLFFPAEITTAYDESTGYGWKRLTERPEDADYEDAFPPLTGDYLFDVNGVEDLQPEDRVYVWANPDGLGWGCNAQVVHKTICEGGELKDQVSTDGGVTWRDPVSIGAACVSQSGSGSGSGGGADPCTACIPPADSPPVAGAGVPIQVSTICLEGILYVTEAKARIVFDETNRVPKLELYDYNVYAEGCCECSGSGSGGCPGPALTLTIDCTVE